MTFLFFFFFICYSNAHNFHYLFTTTSLLKSAYGALNPGYLATNPLEHHLFPIKHSLREIFKKNSHPNLRYFLTFLVFLVLLQHTHKTQPKPQHKDRVSTFICKLFLLGSHSFPHSTLNSSSLGFIIHRQLLDK